MGLSNDQARSKPTKTELQIRSDSGEEAVCKGCGQSKPVHMFLPRRYKFNHQGVSDRCRNCMRKAKTKSAKKFVLRAERGLPVKPKTLARSIEKLARDAKTALRALALRDERTVQATPAWADEVEILKIYKLARELTAATGTSYHVDHVIPLAGRDVVCGLHNQFNLEPIPGTDNVRKSNKFEPIHTHGTPKYLLDTQKKDLTPSR